MADLTIRSLIVIFGGAGAFSLCGMPLSQAGEAGRMDLKRPKSSFRKRSTPDGKDLLRAGVPAQTALDAETEPASFQRTSPSTGGCSLWGCLRSERKGREQYRVRRRHEYRCRRQSQTNKVRSRAAVLARATPERWRPCRTRSFAPGQ